MVASHLALFKFGLFLKIWTKNLKSSCILGTVNSSKSCLNHNIWFSNKIKLKLSKRACLYYSNSSACQRLLLNYQGRNKPLKFGGAQDLYAIFFFRKTNKYTVLNLIKSKMRLWFHQCSLLESLGSPSELLW